MVNNSPLRAAPPAPPAPAPTTGPAAVPEASRVTVKLPPFWENRPEIWFLQLEAQFAIARITTEETRFHHLVAQLDPKYIENCWDIIQSDSEDKYSEAKGRLLSIFNLSEEAKLRDLLNVELGALKPSQLLLRMKSLAGKEITGKALRTLWMDKLPESIRSVLVISQEDLDRQAAMADRLSELRLKNETCSVAATPGSANRDSDHLAARLRHIEGRLAEIPLGRSNQRDRPTGRDRRTSHSRPGSSSRNRNHQGSQDARDECFYHARFGRRARKCQSPCKWRRAGNYGQQQDARPALLHRTN